MVAGSRAAWPAHERRPKACCVTFDHETSPVCSHEGCTFCRMGDLALTDTKQEHRERIIYPRLQAPVYWRPVGLPLFRRKRRPIAGTLGGARVYTDEELRERTRLEIEVFLPDGTSVICNVQVASGDKLPEGGPARFDMEVEFIAIRPHDRERISGVLVQK